MNVGMRVAERSKRECKHVLGGYAGKVLDGSPDRRRGIDSVSKVFDRMPVRDVVSWSTVIAGNAQNEARFLYFVKHSPYLCIACSVLNGKFDQGRMIFRQMLKDKVKPMHDSFSSVIQALCSLDCPQFGETDPWICIFDKIEANNMVSWTAIIMGCAMRGHALDAVSLFEQMLMDGVEPDYVAFMAVLTACSHAGLTCLAELEDWRKPMTSASVWLTLLAACRPHKNVELAEKVLDKIILVDPENIGANTLMSNIYFSAQGWKDASKLRI
ncbi:hypothetical protein AHAS_Ahas13G0468000 [Arachis hypogaea]